MRLQITNILRLLLLLTILTNLVSCEVENLQDNISLEKDLLGDGNEFTSDCSPRNSTPLYAGQHINVGEVSVRVLDTNYEITYSITDKNFCLTSTHLSVVDNPKNFPMSKSGNPKNGQFEYGDDELECTYTISYLVPMSKGTYIAAHAVVSSKIDSKNNSETAWGDGCDFPGNNWATYFQFFSPDEW